MCRADPYNAVMFAIGFGPYYEPGIRTLATEEEYETVYFSPTMAELPAIATTIASIICNRQNGTSP
jgi:hypothetical protein